MAILTRFLSIQLLVAASVSCGAQELLPDLPLAGHADEISRSQRVTGGTTTPWVLQLRGSESDAVRALAVSPDGSILVAGQFEADIEIGFDMLVSAGDSDAFLARLSPLGEPIWAVRIGGPGFDAASGVAVDRDGNATVVGEFSGSVTFEGGRLSAKGGRDLFAIAFTPDGVARWSSAWGGAGWETVDAAAAAPDGGVLVAGARVGEVAIADRSRPDADVDPTMDVDVDVDADADGFLTRIAPGGARTWTVRLGGRGWDQAHAIAVGPDGTIAVAGSFADRMSIGRTGL
ncbi:MAG TPA: hypothetical protein VEL05_02550, partial [Candidatus Acidoferrum sp.]|nr:hypothetical protein [Candidatus Acidoferrum sp.]